METLQSKEYYKKKGGLISRHIRFTTVLETSILLLYPI